MSIRTLQSAEHHGCDVSEVEVTEAVVEMGRQVGIIKSVAWEASCPRCGEYIGNNLTDDEAFAAAEQHVCQPS